MPEVLLQRWKFMHGDVADAGVRGLDDSAWRDVIVPHDWSVLYPFSRENSSGTGYLPGGTGWYRTAFRLPEVQRGSRVLITFDGVYKNSQVWCNGNYLGRRPSGYADFTYDISPFVGYGDFDNVIAVRVMHEDIADSRWFTGSGIYRKVSVRVCPPVYAPQTSLFFTVMPGTDEPTRVWVRGVVRNDTGVAQDAEVVATLRDADGHETALTPQTLTVDADGEAAFALAGMPAQARLWSPDAPNLYTLQVTVRGEADAPNDPIAVGIRDFRFDPDHGFFLNGEHMKIKGVCVHHDAGCLGAAVWPAVWARRLEKLKAMGCNAIRMAHNPHMPELYDLCDRMGFLVMDEAFDEWEGVKNKWAYGHNVYPPRHEGYYEAFPAWHEADLTAMVERDRNHPSVILWSVGNEIDYPNDPYGHPLFEEMVGNNDRNKPRQEMQYSENKPNMERLVTIARRLAEIVRRADDTRPVLTASAFPELSSQLGFFEPFDVMGYNYKEHLYAGDHARFPELPIFGSENSHSLEAWRAVTDNDYIAGQWLWTGIDFLGETVGWPWHGSQAGLLDVAGNEKPGYYRRKCLWNEAPAAYLFTGTDDRRLVRGYDYAPGEMVRVVCYTTLAGAELFCNGHSLGWKGMDAGTDHLEWSVPFERGTLRAVAGDEGGGGVTVEDVLESVLPAVRIVGGVWKARNGDGLGDADGVDAVGAYALRQVEIALVDEQDRVCAAGEALLHFTLEGPGVLLGIENGNLADMDEYALPQRRAYRGRAVAYVLVPAGDGGSGGKPVELVVSAEGFADLRVDVG